MKAFASLTLCAATVCLSMPVAAQFAKPEDAIKYRQSAMTVMGAHFGRVAGMANGKIPFDAKVAADNATIAETMSKLPWAGFGEGTDKGATTRAKPEIWTDNAKFKESGDKMQAEMVSAIFALSAATFASKGILPLAIAATRPK